MHREFLYNIIFLPVILVISAIATYEDFKFSKVSNKLIIAGLSYSLIVYWLAWILYGLGLAKLSLLWNFDKWLINLLISTVVAYIIWHFKMWGAGDAKFFICCSALFPIGQYSLIYFNYYFPSFLLLIMIFIPATAFLLLKSCIALIIRLNSGNERNKLLKSAGEKLKKPDVKAAAKVIFGFFVSFMFFKTMGQRFTNLTKFSMNQNMTAVIFLFVFKPLTGIFKKSLNLLIIIFSFLIIYIFLFTAYPLGQLLLKIKSSFLMALVIMVLFPTLKKIVEVYVEDSEKKTTPFAVWISLGVLLSWFLRYLY